MDSETDLPAGAPDLPDLARPLVLVGMMGVGKTTVGRRLARELGLGFIDCDSAIEDAAGMTVSEIFDCFGEQEFRRGERRVMARLMDEGPRVIATGGGAFADAETRALIKQHGLSVWLDAEVAVLAERTARRDTRPLLRGVDRVAVLSDLLAKRRPCYREADIRVESGPGPHGEVVERILAALRARS